MKLNSTISFGFIFSLTVLSGENHNWNKWRGPDGNGNWNGPKIQKELPGTGLRRIWQSKISPGYSGVTVCNGLVYTMDRPVNTASEETERVLCLDMETGKLRWEFSYPCRYEKMDYGKGPRASVTILDGKAYSLGAMGHAHCLDAVTGRLIWKRAWLGKGKAKAPIWGFSSSPEPFNDAILFHVGNETTGNIQAVSRHSGETLWTVGDDTMAGYAPPLTVEHLGNIQLVCWGPNKIMGLPIGGGEQYWSIPYEVKYGVSIAKPIFEEGILLVSGFWNGTRAIEIQHNRQGKLLWSEEEKLRGLMSQPLYSNGICYLLDRSYGLTAFELKTGIILWRDNHNLTAKDRNPQATLVWTNRKKGEALALNAEGELVFLHLNENHYEEYWREQVSGKTWAHPAYSNSKIYVRDDRGLSCWELPIDR